MGKIISKFHGRMVSMVDVSQSFFQIPLSKDSRKHFAFQGPDRKIYELLRVSQGHHNSPLFLCLCPDVLTILGIQYDSKYLSIPTDRFTAWRKMPVDTPKRIKGITFLLQVLLPIVLLPEQRAATGD